MHKLIICLSIVSLAWAAPQAATAGDLDSIIAEIFGKPNQDTTGQVTVATTVGTPTIRPSTIVPPVNKNSDEVDLSCQTAEGEDGVCTNYYLCNTNNSIITDGSGLIDIRVQEGVCTNYLHVCCIPPDRRTPDNPITPPPDKLPQHEGCGWRNPDGVGFRIKGDIDNEAKFGEFPWMVAILKIEPVNDDDPEGQKLNVYVGGGSLIHPSIVLTAAHYVAISKALRVRAGEWDTQTTNEIYPYQDRDVESVVVHKDYNKNNLFYDIALLFLAKPMEMKPNVGLACLPPSREVPRDGLPCLASGWGKDKFGKEGRYQVILKKVELPVVEKRKCQSALRKTRLGHFFELHSSFMCAGGKGQDTCKGDGGSPLVCPIESEPNRYMQSGIVAWGIGCGTDGTPGVYVDVANLRDWIDDKVAGKGYDPKVYTF